MSDVGGEPAINAVAVKQNSKGGHLGVEVKIKFWGLLLKVRDLEEREKQKVTWIAGRTQRTTL